MNGADRDLIMPSPFHAGEQLAQERAGMRERIERVGRRTIRDFMPEEHRELFAKLPYLLVGSIDSRGRPWASVLVGRPGFVTSPDPRSLAVAARPAAGDPLGAGLRVGAPLGLLGIELATRRRNRMNGTVIAAGANGFTVEVAQSFGNCPKYIQAREPLPAAGPTPVAGPPRPEGARLSPDAAALIRRADTFFIATACPDARGGGAVGGVDVSHRGGKAGFVRVTEEGGSTLLTAPDFLGNFYFNTFGNLAVEPRAGMLFIDFGTGEALSLTGQAEVIWEGPEVRAFAGAERLLRLRVSGGVAIAGAVPRHWSAAEAAPQLATTGSWREAHQPDQRVRA